MTPTTTYHPYQKTHTEKFSKMSNETKMTKQNVLQLRKSRGKRMDVASEEELRHHTQCAMRLKNSELCKGGRIAGGIFCYFHEPSLEEARTESRQKGSEKAQEQKLTYRLNAPVLETPEQVRQLAVETIHQVRTGELGSKEGSIVSSLLGYVLKTMPQVGSSQEDPADKLKKLLMED